MNLFTIARVIAGLLVLVVGLDKFFCFYPLPTGTQEADAFVNALTETGYVMPLVAGIETLAGILFLANRYVALAAVVLMPVSVNAFMFHLFLSQAAMVPTTLLFVLNILILLEKKERFRALFKA